MNSNVERFWRRVDKNGPIPAHRPEIGNCWVWIGSLHKNGYAPFFENRKLHKAHRWIFEQINGALGVNDCCHKCDNRACVRLDHLFVGTRSENIKDCVSKGRHVATMRTHCRQGHEYSAENTIKNPKGWRKCKICNKKWQREYIARTAIDAAMKEKR